MNMFKWAFSAKTAKEKRERAKKRKEERVVRGREYRGRTRLSAAVKKPPQ